MRSIDRRKHDVDVMERVLGGVRELEDDELDMQVVSLRAEPWLAGTTTSAVQVTVGGVEHDEESPRFRAPRRQDIYESDRRGEHKYPDTEQQERERPSHREREELKGRLERRG